MKLIFFSIFSSCFIINDVCDLFIIIHAEFDEKIANFRLMRILDIDLLSISQYQILKIVIVPTREYFFVVFCNN